MSGRSRRGEQFSASGSSRGVAWVHSRMLAWLTAPTPAVAFPDTDRGPARSCTQARRGRTNSRELAPSLFATRAQPIRGSRFHVDFRPGQSVWDIHAASISLYFAVNPWSSLSPRALSSSASRTMATLASAIASNESWRGTEQATLSVPGPLVPGRRRTIFQSGLETAPPCAPAALRGPGDGQRRDRAFERRLGRKGPRRHPSRTGASRES